MYRFLTKYFLPLFIFGILFILLLLILPAVFNSTDIRKKAAGTTADFAVYPSTETFQAGETKTFEVKATFTDPSPNQTIDYLKMTISFPLTYFRIPDGNYVKIFFTGQNNLERMIRVDGPIAANQSGKIIVELGAASPGSGPSTGGSVTLARFNLTALQNTSGALPITLTVDQAVTNNSVNLTATAVGADVQVGDTAVTTITPTSLPTGVNCNRSLGDVNCDGVIDGADYIIWTREFSGEITTTRSDINSSGKIDLVDWEIWRRNASSYGL